VWNKNLANNWRRQNTKSCWGIILDLPHALFSEEFFKLVISRCSSLFIQRVVVVVDYTMLSSNETLVQYKQDGPLYTPHTCWCWPPVNGSYHQGTLLELFFLVRATDSNQCWYSPFIGGLH
jgi:hypothetical protein